MTARSKSFACGLLATALVAGCGGSKAGAPIPRASADDLTSRLTEARNRSTPLRCSDLRRDTLPVLENDARNLPQNVDQKVRTTVSDGVAHLRDLVQQQCDAERRQRQQQTTSTDTTPTTPPSTAQPTAPPSTTETTPPPTATTPPATTKSTPTPSSPSTNGSGGNTPPAGQGDGAGGNTPPGQGGQGGALGGAP